MELEREILVDAPPHTIYELLTDPQRHLLWEGTEVQIDPTPGGVYRVLIAGEYQSAGSFVDLVPDEKVMFTFGWEMDDNPIGPGSTTVEVTLSPEGEKTRVRLRHSGLPDSDAVEAHTLGWDHYLDRLAVAATGGDPGLDRGPEGS